MAWGRARSAPPQDRDPFISKARFSGRQSFQNASVKRTVITKNLFMARFQRSANLSKDSWGCASLRPRLLQFRALGALLSAHLANVLRRSEVVMKRDGLSMTDP